MSDHDRGPYTPPSEPPLAFDPRRPVRGAGPAPVTLIVSALVLVGLVGGVIYVYRGGVRHGNQPPAPVGQPLGDIKGAAPPDAAGNDAAPGLVIEKVDASNNPEAVNAALAPPPEQPQPRAPVVVMAPPVAPPAAPPAKPAEKLAVLKPPAAPPSVGALADAAERKPVKMLAKPPAAPPAEKAAVAPPAGANWVQIGAFTSTAQAEKGWTDIARLEPAAMAGKGKKLEAITKGGVAYYRTYVTGFSSHADAVKFCVRLTAAKKPCIVK